LLVGKKGKENEVVHLENDDFADESRTSRNENLQEIIPVIEEESESEEESEEKKAKKKMAAPEISRVDKSSSKSKKKKDKIKEIMLEDGTKKRKKTKRRSSMKNTSNYSPPSPVKFGSSGEGEHSSSFADGESSKFSTRTDLTERSSSHHSMSSERIEAFKSETPQETKKKSQKNIQEIDGQLWRCDEKGNPISKVRKKMSKSGDIDRLCSSDHGSPTTISETPTKRKNKKGSLSKGYKSVRHISSTGNNGYNSSGSEEKMNDTVGTTGTKSLDDRPKPRRLKSQSDMGSLPEDDSSSFRRKKPERTPSGDLDMLMSQSVHDHTRKVPSMGKPKLQRKGSTMGKLLKLAGKSSRILPGKKSTKVKGLVTSRSNPDVRSLLPNDVKEIDGVLWKVDEYGNKMNKVKHSSMSGCSSDEEDDSDDDFVNDSDNDSQNMYDIGWSGKLENVGGHKSSSGGSVSGGSVSGRSTSNRGEPERKERRQGRRSSMGNKGPSASRDRSVSVSSRRRTRSRSNDKARDDSTKSLYTNNAPKKPDRHRSRSNDKSRDDSTKSLYTNDAPKKPDRHRSRSDDRSVGDEQKRSRSKSKGRGDNHNLVQNLQHRLRASEKEVASLCRTSMEQQDQVSELTTDLRKAQAKLKTANSYKFALTGEVDKLKHEIEVKSMLERKNELPKEETNNSGNDRMVAQVCGLKQDKQCLQMNLEDEKTRSQARLEVKDDEIRFLQEELERMRSQQGDQYLSYMQKVPRCPSSDEESLNSGKRLDRGRSMHFVGKILGNHNNVQAQTDLALKKQEIRDLQDRVNNLQTSNEKLKKELKDATLTIKDDDDDEIRKAKEAAAKASLAASQHRPTGRRRLSIGAMSLY